MKLTEKKLKDLIMEVLDDADLDEAKESKYDRVMSILKGEDPSVNTIAIMSGQNPMAKQASDLDNEYLKRDLEKAIEAENMKAIRVGGNFMGIFEQSAMILNPPDKDIIEQLNRQFTQWGFVWGEKMTIEEGNDKMVFTMYEIDYDNPMGFRRAPGSEQVSQVMDDELMQGGSDYSFIPKAGKGGPDAKVGKKFGIPLYEDLDEEEHPAPNSMMEAMKTSYTAKAKGRKVKFVRGKK